MEFKEKLAQIRRTQGMSQEDLAAKIQVSRQAVSKWETGDALPDLNKLLLLADALEISLDELCGRQVPAPSEAPSAQAAPVPRRRPWTALCALLAVCLLAAGLWGWSRRNIVPAESAPAASSLPDTFTVSGASFYGHDSCLGYQFVPSVSDPSYTYQISFVDSDGAVKAFPVECEGGVCAGEAAGLTNGSSYLVTVSISDGAASINLPIARSLSFSNHGASWTPLD